MDDLAQEIEVMNQSLDRFIEKESARLATRTMQYDCLKHYFRQTGRPCRQKVLKINGHRSVVHDRSCPHPAEKALQTSAAVHEHLSNSVMALLDGALRHGYGYRKGEDGRRGESMTTSRSLPAAGAHLPADGAHFQQPVHAQTSRSAYHDRRSSGAEPRGRLESIRERRRFSLPHTHTLSLSVGGWCWCVRERVRACIHARCLVSAQCGLREPAATHV
jgi:hypothetical protein